MPTIAGGNDEGPTPGFHARAASSGCVAIGIKQEAIFRQIKCESIKVEPKWILMIQLCLGLVKILQHR